MIGRPQRETPISGGAEGSLCATRKATGPVVNAEQCTWSSRANPSTRCPCIPITHRAGPRVHGTHSRGAMGVVVPSMSRDADTAYGGHVNARVSGEEIQCQG